MANNSAADKGRELIRRKSAMMQNEFQLTTQSEGLMIEFRIYEIMGRSQMDCKFVVYTRDVYLS